MTGLTLNLLPYWLVGVVMIYSGIIWLLTRSRQIRMDTRTMAYTLLLQGVGYLVSMTFLDPSLIERILTLRLIIIMLCLSQSGPLTVSYLRRWKAERGLG